MTLIFLKVFRRWYNFSGTQKWYNNVNVNMFDPKLVTEIREIWIVQKSNLTASYTLREENVRNPSMGQAQAIMNIFDNKVFNIYKIINNLCWSISFEGELSCLRFKKKIIILQFLGC